MMTVAPVVKMSFRVPSGAPATSRQSAVKKRWHAVLYAIDPRRSEDLAIRWHLAKGAEFMTFGHLAEEAGMTGAP